MWVKGLEGLGLRVFTLVLGALWVLGAWNVSQLVAKVDKTDVVQAETKVVLAEVRKDIEAVRADIKRLVNTMATETTKSEARSQRLEDLIIELIRKRD